MAVAVQRQNGVKPIGQFRREDIIVSLWNRTFDANALWLELIQRIEKHILEGIENPAEVLSDRQFPNAPPRRGGAWNVANPANGF